MGKDIKELLKGEKAKKGLVFASLGILFAASMYLIFAPSGKNGKTEMSGSGINTTIPQAAENDLAEDKLKVYEFDTEEKEEERERAIGTLAELQESEEDSREYEENSDTEEYMETNHIDHSVRQYRETTEALTSFYDNGYDAEKEEMREEIERLNNEIREMEEAGNEEDEQLALLEKSYQMASKYLPMSGGGQQPVDDSERTAETKRTKDDEPAFEVVPDRNPIVSLLAQPLSDEELMAEYAVERNTGFHTPTAKSDMEARNTIACKVDRTTTVRDNETLQLRLLESVRIGDAVIPKNSLLTARSKLSDNRMMLFVSSVETGGSIYPVKLSAYDMDGLEGVFIPGSEEMDALKEIGADVGSSVGTSFTFSSSAKDQIIADAAKGLMQGTSNYIVKKIRTVKVTFKGGHRLMLIPAK